MRHGDKINNLSRTASHRKALLKNMSNSLILHKRIQTTLAKAKALRRHIEPIITKTKNISTDEVLMHRQRLVFRLLQNEQATKELFTVVGPKVADRPGGYCSIIKLGRRKTDSAEMAYIEFIDFNEVRAAPQDEKSDNQLKKTRTRRSGAKKVATTTAKDEIATTDKEAVETSSTKEKKSDSKTETAATKNSKKDTTAVEPKSKKDEQVVKAVKKEEQQGESPSNEK